MVNPVTVNVGIIVPLTGADVDLWGEDDVNPNMVAIDGLIAGVQTVALTNVPVTLSSPAGFVPTPGPGPTQSQNRVLRFTGTLTGDVMVTLPLPGVYVIENQTVQGVTSFVVQLRGAVATTEIIALPFGSTVTVSCDGSNVRFVDLGKMGDMEFWVGIIGMPRWATSCTKAPYLPCDGSVATYNFSDFPQLGARLLGNFGGNGITTFGVPDSAGRFPLAYDRTGIRITTAGSGLNGQTMGAVNGASAQSSQLATANLPAYTPSGTNSTSLATFTFTTSTAGSPGPLTVVNNIVAGSVSGTTVQAPVGAQTFTGTAQGGLSQIFSNVPPAQVSGIWVIKT